MSDVTYDVFPLDASPARAEILSRIMRKIAVTENVFADYTGTCEEGCTVHDVTLNEMCRTCQMRMGIIAQAITSPSSRVWEVWKTNGVDPEVVGVISFTDIQPGVDAKAHYVFFDHRLADKTPIMQDIIDWAFEDHEGWKALGRLTIEIPRPFAALAHHASRRLGFGGAFRYVLKESEFKGEKKRTSIKVEGVKRGAVRWKGTEHDLLILGLRARDASLSAKDEEASPIPSTTP